MYEFLVVSWKDRRPPISCRRQLMVLQTQIRGILRLCSIWANWILAATKPSLWVFCDSCLFIIFIMLMRVAPVKWKLIVMLAVIILASPNVTSFCDFWDLTGSTGLLINCGARVFAARGKRLCCHPTPAIRSPIDILIISIKIVHEVHTKGSKNDTNKMVMKYTKT